MAGLERHEGEPTDAAVRNTTGAHGVPAAVGVCGQDGSIGWGWHQASAGTSGSSSADAGSFRLCTAKASSTMASIA